MGKPPQRPKVQLPSPLQQVHYTRPLSQPPQEMGLVRDPAFWKRFSFAVHQADGDSEKGSAVSVDTNDQWLIQQHEEKRRCRVLCMTITMAVVLLIVAAAVCGWYFTTQFSKSK